MVFPGWKISIISTDYDLHEHRVGLSGKLEELGYRVLAFERDDFPIEPDLNSHDVCLTAVKKCDIAILLIDRRYGGLYIGDQNKSITEKEYEEIRKSGKIILQFVSKSAWDERHRLFSELKDLCKNSDITELEAKKKLKPVYVEKWEVLEFIEKIRKVRTGNWVVPFDSLDTLLAEVLGKLQSISRYILQQLVQSQITTVRRAKTTTGMDLSIGDVLDKKYYIPPPYKIQSGNISPSKPITKSIISRLSKGESILLSGEPGAGKSTFISALFLKHAKSSIKNKSTILPFFFSLRSRGSEFVLNIDNIISKLFAENLKKKIYPSLDTQDINFIWYLDGLDELVDDPLSFNLKGLVKSEISCNTIILSARSRFLLSYCSTADFNNKFDQIINLIPWEKNHAEQYINNFCNTRKCSNLIPDLLKALKGPKGISEFSKNPLHLTLYLWIVEVDGMRVPTDIYDELTLYDKLIELMALRDVDRKSLPLTIENISLLECFVDTCRTAAWHIHEKRHLEEKLTWSGLIEDLKDKYQLIIKFNVIDSFRDLFDVTGFSEKVIGMRHEQLLEHLLAGRISEDMYTNVGVFPLCLKFILKHEINRRLRAIWSRWPDSKKLSCLDNLWNAYINLLCKTKDDEIIIQKDQVLYYIGRLGIKECEQKLRDALVIEKDTLPLHCIYFGLMKLGQFDIEDSFFNLLCSDDKEDEVNRGYHIRYYNDWKIYGSNYSDPLNTQFDNTCNIILKHFADSSVKHVILRRVELFTLRRLIETRKSKGILTSSNISFIRTTIESTSSLEVELPDAFVIGLKAELQLFLSAISSIDMIA